MGRYDGGRIRPWRGVRRSRCCHLSSRRSLSQRGLIACRIEQALKFGGVGRSEEHTSELQSLMRSSYAVFGLKKKTALAAPVTMGGLPATGALGIVREDDSAKHTPENKIIT